MRIEDLEIFLLIAELRNLHRVAEQTGLSQSAVTKALRRLESELRVDLCERAPRGVVLTDIGAAFAHRIKKIDYLLEEAQREVWEMREGQLGVIRLGVVPISMASSVGRVVRWFSKNRPKVRFQMSVNTTTILLQALMDGKLDFVLGIKQEVVPPDLEFEVFQELKTEIVVRSSHPLAADCSMEDLVKARWILPPEGQIPRTFLTERLGKLGLPPPSVVIETDATSALSVPLLLQDDLVGVVYHEVLYSPMGKGLRPLRHTLGTIDYSLVLYWRKGSYVSPLAADFSTILRAGVTAPGAQPGF